MKFAGIIAAGDGTRLASSHPGTPKPLVQVGGAPLCHWVARSLIQAGAEEIFLLHNSRGRAVRESLERAFPKVRWDFCEADTASSWETFRLVCLALAEKTDEFMISAVDSLIPPDQAAAFAKAATAAKPSASLALTAFVDDEKPLWADVHEGRVIALGPSARQKKLVTSGLYYMTGRIAKRMPPPAAHASLRSYWGCLVASGEPVAGIPLSKTVDVDRPEDIREAEGFLKAASSTW